MSAKLSASQKVEQYIKGAVLQGSLKPRERIIEEDIARRLGCSRGPVREGLLRLQRDGLIVNIPRRGTFVRDISPEIVEVIFRMRAKLEGLAVYYMRKSMRPEYEEELRKRLLELKAASDSSDSEAFLNADMGLHRAIWKLSGREPLFRTLNSLMNPFLYMVARVYSPQMPMTDRLKLHEQYIEMILSTPIKKIEREVEGHFSHLFLTLQFDSNPGFGTQNGDWWLNDLVHP
jgi:DNA-binding GntR family transcriptional regulator